MKYIDYNTPTRIYNHLALGPTAHILGDYKFDIALVGCYNVYL